MPALSSVTENPRMAKFLTEEWSEQAIAALNASDDVRGATKDVRFTIQQVITGAPSGEAKYWVGFSDGSVSGGIGEAPAPDVTITEDYETAEALARAEINPQAAFMQGKLKVAGNMGKLLQHQGAMATIFPVLAELETEY